jgi:integrase
MGFGSLRNVNLALARELAAQARADLAERKDPRRERDARRGSAQTFAEVAEQAMDSFEPKWKSPRTRLLWNHSLRVHVGALRNIPIGRVDTEAVLSALRPIWQKIPVLAEDVRERIESVLNWAKTEGLRQGENPARWKGHLEYSLSRPTREPKHHAALPYEQAPEFIQRFRLDHRLLSRALELTILTACRIGEVLGARWEEIDFEKRAWTIPALRMKMDNAHIVPLSDRAVELLRDLPRVSDLIFPNSRDPNRLYTNMAAHGVLRRVGGIRVGEITIHGFRSTFRMWTQEQTRFEDCRCRALSCACRWFREPTSLCAQ